MEDVKLPIDRHSKKRAILIDEKVLYNPSCQDYINELIDINELSSYFDTIILSTDLEYCESYLRHNALESLVVEKYTNYKSLKDNYRFLLMICTKKESNKLKDYYKCEILTR